ncbi:MAG: HAD family phosphatase [Bacteroidetes bacterium]|nr:HAD family phosphatase [Bacteroidota bacterium]
MIPNEISNNKYKGIIFDFNGTMFWDNEFHIRAWVEFSIRHGCKMTREDYLTDFIGKTSAKSLEILLGIEIDDVKLDELHEEKEAIYRRMCLEDTMNFVLAPGLIPILDELAARSVPRAIATASALPNVEFFIEQFQLERWFDTNHIVYDDGHIANKPAPDIYLLAAERLGFAPQDLIIVEDSATGAEAAHKAGAGCIVLTGEDLSLQDEWIGRYPVCRRIPNFHEMEIDVFAESDIKK